MLSIAFIMAFVVAAVSMILGIFIYSEVSSGIEQTFEPLLINTNGTGFTSITSIDHTYAEQTTAQTHTGDTNYTTIPNISLPSGTFITGNQYLIQFRADVIGDSIPQSNHAQYFSIRSQHGSTDFVGSEKVWSHRASGAGTYQYHWFTVWTAVAGEDLTMQFRNVNDSTRTVQGDQLQIVAIDLEDFVENEDWFYDERTTQDTLECVEFHVSICNPAGSWTQTNPSITVTTNGSDDWLVMATTQTDPDSSAPGGWTHEVQSRLNLDDTILTPLMREEGREQDVHIQVHFLARVYTPSDSSHTFKNEASLFQGQSEPTRDYSNIFAINLDKFEYHVDNYDPTFSTTSTDLRVFANGLPQSPPFESNTMTVDSPSTEDTFILAFNIMDHEHNSGSNFKQRMQIDDGSGTNFILDPTQNEEYKDQPPTQTKPLNIVYIPYDHGIDADEVRWSSFTMENLSTSYPLNNGVVDIDVDSVNAITSINKVKDSQLVAISMSAKTFEYEDTTPEAFTQADSIAFTILAIIPITLFFALFTILSPRID